ncbi:Fur family transcriptional regulator [Enteractinococcus coprophilus]|uniref:Fur family ferric uptake transcriptional regulator n=1 Tax=Enteractinococcus coprophilus TaxID=1027633 RepID=A0A543AFJ3_9MICC|nr:Fur family transcriptional regulator [Enteractinococcus coprophilus]TQL71355.1 Fur family ferric uptake transcriptional regulator [Enteractinococcus coprophilus]
MSQTGHIINWPSRIRATGLRSTRQRVATLESLAGRPHATADELLNQVRHALPAITIQSIYTVVQSLVDVGLVRKLEFGPTAARFEIQHFDNHHHVHCRLCGRIEDVACQHGSAPCMTPVETHGMVIDTADVVYHGTCTDCLDALDAPDGDTHVSV